MSEETETLKFIDASRAMNSEPNTELDEIINEFITDTVTDTDTNVAHLKAELSKWRAQKVAEAVEAARSRDPHKCEYGHEVYSHNTADGWCCACDHDIAVLNSQLKADKE